jgi:Spy/CpxP family protein refolding chaperone
MKKGNLITVLILVLSIGTGITAFGQEAESVEKKKETRASDREAMFRKRLAELPNMTDDQLSQLEALRVKQKESLAPLRKQMKEFHTQMRELKSSQNMEFEKMKRMIEEMGSMEIKMKIAKLENTLKMREVLTEDQRKAFQAQRKAHFQQKKGNHNKQKKYLHEHGRGAGDPKE